MSQSHPEGIPAPQHRTISLEEVHHIGNDRRPVLNHRKQQIEALEPIRSFPYYFLAIERVSNIQGIAGCAPADRRPFNPRLLVSDIVLDQPLGTGQRTTVEYTSWFDYDHLPPPEVRHRIGQLGVEQLGITVRFEEAQLPTHVWHAEWDGTSPDSLVIPDSRVELELEPVPESQGLAGVMQVQHSETDPDPLSVRGIYWEWPAAL